MFKIKVVPVLKVIAYLLMTSLLLAFIYVSSNPVTIGLVIYIALFIGVELGRISERQRQVLKNDGDVL